MLALRKHVANHVVDNGHNASWLSTDRIHDDCHAFGKVFGADCECIRLKHAVEAEGALHLSAPQQLSPLIAVVIHGAKEK